MPIIVDGWSKDLAHSDLGAGTQCQVCPMKYAVLAFPAVSLVAWVTGLEGHQLVQHMPRPEFLCIQLIPV